MTTADHPPAATPSPLPRAERDRLRALAEAARDAEARVERLDAADAAGRITTGYAQAMADRDDANDDFLAACDHRVVLSLLDALDARERLGVDQEGSTARTESTQDAMMRLARFGAWAIRELRDDNIGSDLDGGWAQDEALRLGVLVSVRMSQPCGEDCACAEYAGDFPTECYRFPGEITQALRTLMLTERVPVPAVEPSRSIPDALAPTSAAAHPEPGASRE